MQTLKSKRLLQFHQSINEASIQIMSVDPSVCIFGHGVNDSSGVFGTTQGIKEKYGGKRVMDLPISENTMTGIGIGVAISKMRPILVYQRADFSLSALDQIVNNAAKWHFMFGGQMICPLVIRLIIGRGWRQSPQYSQSLQSIFSHIPGLKVVMPSSPYDAKGLLYSAVKDDNPVVFFEHRWLHETQGHVPSELFEIPLGKANIIYEGSDITIAACSQMTLEARKAADQLIEEGVSVELIDIRSVKPLDKETLIKSVRKTGRLIIADPDYRFCGFASEVITTVCEEAFHYLKSAPVRITFPDTPSPASWALANHYYPSSLVIAFEAFKLLRSTSKAQHLVEELIELRTHRPLDVPSELYFKCYD